MNWGTLVDILLASHYARALVCVINWTRPVHSLHRTLPNFVGIAAFWKSMLPHSSAYRIDFCPEDGGSRFLAKRWYQNTRLHSVIFRKTVLLFTVVRTTLKQWSMIISCRCRTDGALWVSGSCLGAPKTSTDRFFVNALSPEVKPGPLPPFFPNSFFTCYIRTISSLSDLNRLEVMLSLCTPWRRFEERRHCSTRS